MFLLRKKTGKQRKREFVAPQRAEIKLIWAAEFVSCGPVITPLRFLFLCSCFISPAPAVKIRSTAWKHSFICRFTHEHRESRRNEASAFTLLSNYYLSLWCQQCFDEHPDFIASNIFTSHKLGEQKRKREEKEELHYSQLVGFKKQKDGGN